jgi:hypothetical protein
MARIEHQRADDDGMAQEIRRPAAPPGGVAGAHEMLRTLEQLCAGGGERDEPSLARFEETVGRLRALPGATGVFRAKVASAGGWAALLFSSWRFRKYDRPDESGAARVRRFIARDLAEARALAPEGPPA